MKQSKNSLDTIVEKINSKLGRILGKNKKLHKGKNRETTTSNTKFILLVTGFAILLWISTGFYYLGENQVGVIFNNGRVSNVLSGVKVGLIRPYPFANIEIINSAATDFINLDQDDAVNGYKTLNEDLIQVWLKGKFTYRVADPRLMVLNSNLKEGGFSSVVKFTIWQQLHSYISNKTWDELKNGNLTVMANEIKQNTNNTLASIGLQVVRLQIDSLNLDSGISLAAESSVAAVNLANKNSQIPGLNTVKNVEIPTIVENILDEARRYQMDKITEVQLNIKHFHELLPQYKINPEAVAEQMYYDMLEKVPSRKDERYSLLNMNLSDLFLKAHAANSNDEMQLENRYVDRARDLRGRN